MNKTSVAVLLGMLMASCWGMSNSNWNLAQQTLVDTLQRHAQGDSSALGFVQARVTAVRASAADLECMRGDFEVVQVDYYPNGVYQFLVRYPATNANFDAYVRNQGWLFSSFALDDVGRCRKDWAPLQLSEHESSAPANVLAAAAAPAPESVEDGAPVDAPLAAVAENVAATEKPEEEQFTDGAVLALQDTDAASTSH